MPVGDKGHVRSTYALYEHGIARHVLHSTDLPQFRLLLLRQQKNVGLVLVNKFYWYLRTHRNNLSKKLLN